MSYTTDAQLLKDEGFRERVRIALYEWCIAVLTTTTPDATEKAWAKQILRARDDVSYLTTLIRVMVLANGWDSDAETDDAVLQTRVDQVVPIAIAKEVLTLTDPDAP